jgi:acyl-CoA thioester hydrolase
MPEFSFPIRVYYDDTDAGGVVYHSNYLKFMERARTEWLSHLDLEIMRLADEYGIIFVVRAAKIEYLKPARLSDRLNIHVVLEDMRRSSTLFKQKVMRDDHCLATGEIQVVAVDAKTFKPCALPPEVRTVLEPWRSVISDAE